MQTLRLLTPAIYCDDITVAFDDVIKAGVRYVHYSTAKLMETLAYSVNLTKLAMHCSKPIDINVLRNVSAACNQVGLSAESDERFLDLFLRYEDMCLDMLHSGT